MNTFYMSAVRYQRIMDFEIKWKLDNGRFFFEASERIVWKDEEQLRVFYGLVDKAMSDMVANNIKPGAARNRCNEAIRAMMIDGLVWFEDEQDEEGTVYGDDEVLVIEVDESYMTHPQGKKKFELQTFVPKAD